MTKTIEQTSVSGIMNITFDAHRDIFIKKDIGFIMSTHNLSASGYRNIEVYRATDYQIVIVNGGSLEIECNLHSLRLKSGDILAFSPGTLICTRNRSTDYDATIISLGAHALDSVHSFGYRLLTLADSETISIYVALISGLSRDAKGSRAVIMAVDSLFAYLLEHSLNEEITERKNDRKRDIFKSFVDLVNKSGEKHHQSGFYADSLGVSLNYLNDIVKEKSGRTVFQWINGYLITVAKVMLLHSSDTVLQISDHLNFPNSAFFCRFFKQHTGLTPSQFRKNG